jgi:endonuclease YncB( thermonuclease family)
MKTLMTILLSAALSSSALAGTPILIDGDTFVHEGERIRIIEIDTPETWRPRCERELQLGLAAKQELRRLFNMIDDKHPLTIVPEKKDYWRRTLAYVYVGEINVGEAMIASGHALRYTKGAAAKAERLSRWCAP